MDSPEALGWCRTSMLWRAKMDVESLCGDLTFMASECRSGWVHARLHPSMGHSTESLLVACDSHADCALQVLDARPEAEPAAQIERCMTYAEAFAADCAHHTLQRWKLGEPTPTDAEALVGVSGLPPSLVGVIGSYLGEVSECLGGVVCTGSAEIRRACEDTARTMRSSPDRCEMAFAPGPARLRGR